MSGFLDRLAARAVGEAPLVHPRVRSRFEPNAAELVGGVVEEVVEERTAPAPSVLEESVSPRTEMRSPAAAARTFEPQPRSLPSPPSPPDPTSAGLHPKALSGPQEIDPTVETPRGASPAAATTIRGDVEPIGPEVSAVRSEDAGASAHLTRSLRRDRRFGDAPRGVSTVGETASTERPAASPAPAEAEPLRPPLRLRSTLAETLPTVEPGRRVPLPPPLGESEPPETVVHVSIGRIDVRASHPPAPERRPARPTGPRLTLADYLKRREERRR